MFYGICRSANSHADGIPVYGLVILDRQNHALAPPQKAARHHI